MKAQNVEDLLQDQLAACLAATEDCLSQSRVVRTDDPDGQLRRLDLDHVARLMKASANLTTALAHLRGNTRHSIHVTRGVAALGHVTPGVAALGRDHVALANPGVDKGEG